jgi:hypothetical protein
MLPYSKVSAAIKEEWDIIYNGLHEYLMHVINILANWQDPIHISMNSTERSYKYMILFSDSHTMSSIKWLGILYELNHNNRMDLMPDRIYLNIYIKDYLFYDAIQHDIAVIPSNILQLGILVLYNKSIHVEDIKSFKYLCMDLLMRVTTL